MKSIFNGVSLATTTGLSSAPFALWPSFIPMFLMVAAIVGGCAASTSGGIKIIRLLLLQKQGKREINRLVHPRAVIPLKFGSQRLPEHVLQAMWGFIAAFITLFIIIVFFLLGSGLNLQTAFGATVASLANVGAGIGDVANGYANLTDMSKWVLIFAMLAGRLEIFTLLVLFSPAFWRR